MTCPECGEKTRVYDTVKTEDAVYRKRLCKTCNRFFFTTETDSDSAEFYRVKDEMVRLGLSRQNRKPKGLVYNPNPKKRRLYYEPKGSKTKEVET